MHSLQPTFAQFHHVEINRPCTTSTLKGLKQVSLGDLSDDTITNIIRVGGWNLGVIAALACTSKRFNKLAKEKLFPGGAAHLFREGMRLFWEQGKPLMEKKSAFRCFAMAAKLGHADAQFMLGICYQDGVGVPFGNQSSTDAAECFVAAANQGHSIALIALCEYYSMGWVFRKNLALGMDLGSQGLQTLSRYSEDEMKPIVEFYIGFWELFEHENGAKAIPYFESSCEYGYWRGASYLFFIVYKFFSNAPETDDSLLSLQERMLACVCQAANQGFAEAEFLFGGLQMTGFGMIADAVAGHDWVLQASRHGHVRAHEFAAMGG